MLDDNAIALTIASPQLPRDELEEAKQLAAQIGITHIIIDGNLLDASWFEDNPPDRCYICKKDALNVLLEYCQEHGLEGQLVEGTNFDDIDDYRPGYKAIQELTVRSPLIDAKLTKKEIRQLSKQLGIICWDKPASPCLATRFPFGEKITPEKMNTVFEAEKYLKSLGLPDVRVRVHGRIARIEISNQLFNIIFNNTEQITTELKKLGFDFITLDLGGYRKGSMNKSS